MSERDLWKLPWRVAISTDEGDEYEYAEYAVIPSIGDTIDISDGRHSARRLYVVTARRLFSSTSVLWEKGVVALLDARAI